jgi:hypothetical protein
MLLLAMVCARSTRVLQPREFSEMVVRSIPEWFASAEWLELLVLWLPLGVKVAAYRPWLRSFLADFACFARVIFQI